MKNLLLTVTGMLTAATISSAAFAESAFVTKFTNYRSKHKISTYRAAQAFAKAMKTRPEQILKRYVSEAYSGGGRHQDAAIVHGIDALKESGLSHGMALSRVSDMVGQMTETLEAIYQRSAGRPIAVSRSMEGAAKRAKTGRSLASVRGK